MLVHHRVTPSTKFAGTHLYAWAERGNVRVKCPTQEHNRMTQPGLKPGPRNLEMSILPMRPPCLLGYYLGLKEEKFKQIYRKVDFSAI